MHNFEFISRQSHKATKPEIAPVMMPSTISIGKW